jgi:MiaB-like tRNA modifying enzyme
MESLVLSDIVDEELDADVVVINSCTVTNSADSNLKQYISHIKKNNSKAKIILTGCSAHSIGKDLYMQNKVFGVFGHKEKELINNFITKNERFFELGDLDFVNQNIVTKIKNRSRAFIKIQEGCDFDCGYCIIPFVRGRARSMPENKILEQIKLLCKNGFEEFVLTGINMGSYGKDTNTSLAKLLDKIFQIDKVKRVRLGSLEPSQIDEEFIKILDNPILERHLHIALQYADDRMLRIMKRRNRVNKSLSLFEKLADKGFALGTDYIVGHPGESEEIFQSGYENLKKFPLTHIHLFRYSPRDGTHSATLKQIVKGDKAKQRHKIITELIKQKNYQFRLQKPKLKVLVEELKNGYYQGFDQFFNKILIQSQIDLRHSWVEIEEYEVKEVNYATK